MQGVGRWHTSFVQFMSGQSAAAPTSVRAAETGVATLGIIGSLVQHLAATKSEEEVTLHLQPTSLVLSANYLRVVVLAGPLSLLP